MIRYLKISICFFVAVVFASCSKEEVNIEDYEQVFDVQQFETQLNSITPLNDSTYIVGGKTGDIFIVQNAKVLHHLATASDHIYTALKDSLGSWWIGTRNDGLHHWDGKKPDMATPTRKYIIPMKGTGYSVYNLLPLSNDSILVGTSNGLYRAAINGSNTLDSLYSRPNNTTEKPKPVEFRTPVVLSPDSIFYPSQDGIYYVGKRNRKIWFDKGKDFKALCLSPDSAHLYALSAGSKGNDDFLWIFKNKKNPNECTPIDLSFSADYLLQVYDKVYLLSKSYLYATLVGDLGNGKPRFARVPLKRRLPEKTKSGFIHDCNTDRIRIVTERSVLSFPARNGMADRSRMMKLACVDNATGNIFFLNSINELYEYDPRLGSKAEAQKVLDLAPSSADVTALHVDKGTMYYEINHNLLFKCVISGIQKYGLWWIRTKRITQYSKSTALLIENDTVFVGLKDSILSFPIISPDKKNTISSDTYATRLRKTGDNTVATTLNDGLLINNYPAICRNIRFQADYSVANDSLALLLNNHFLYLLKDTDVVDSEALKGFSKIFISPNSRGVAVSTDSLQWFSLQDSIILDKATFGHHIIDGCVQKDSTLFISTEGGVEIVAMSQNTVDTENAPIYLRFSNRDFKSYERSRIIIWYAVIALIVIIVSVGIWFNLRNNWKKIIERLKHIESERDNFAHKLTEANENINRIESERNIFSQKLTEASEKATRLESERENLAHKLTEANENINRIENERDNFSQKLTEANQSINILQQDKGKLYEELKGIQNQIEKLQGEVEKAQKKLRGNYEKRIEILQQYREYLGEERNQILAHCGTLVKKIHETDKESSADSDELNIKILELEFVLPLILNDILKGQISDMKHEKKWDKHRDNIRKIIDYHDLKEKEKCIKENKKLLDSLEKQRHREKEWLKSYDYAFFKMRLKGEKPGLSHATTGDGKTTNPHKKPSIEEVKQALENLATVEGRTMVEQYIKRQRDKIEAAHGKIDAETELCSILELIKGEYSKLETDTLDDNIGISMIQNFIHQLFNLHTRLNVVSEICEIHDLLIKYIPKYEAWNRIYKSNRTSTMKQQHILDKGQEARDIADENSKKNEVKVRLAEIIEHIKNLCKDMNDCCDKEGLLDKIGLKLQIKDNNELTLNPIVLAVSMADYDNKIPYGWITFGKENDQEIKVVKYATQTYSNGIGYLKEKINSRKSFIEDYTLSNPTSIGLLLLKIGSDNRRES